MIYNVFQYLKNELPGERIYVNVWDVTGNDTSVDDRVVLLEETGGDSTPWFDFQNKTIQVIARDVDQNRARELAYDVYDALHNRYGIQLPDYDDDGTVYPGIQLARCHAIQIPQSIGYDTNGRAEFTTNYMINY